MKYKVLQPLSHDGESYVLGDEVELTEKQAAPLIALEVVAQNKAAKKTDSKTE